jgi:hypothetical protein
MRIRVIAWLALGSACIVNLPGASRPPVATGGTWSCQQIAEQCDSACQSPSCLDECTTRGTPEAQQQHNAVVSCGQRNFCTNEDCMRANCNDEMQGCAAEPAAEPQAAPKPVGDSP